MSADAMNILSIFSGAFSIGISFIAMILSASFYFAGRNTEKSVAVSLARIEAQTDSLQKLSGKQIDKLMKHALDGHNQVSTNDTMLQLMNVLSQMPVTITTILKNPSDNSDKDHIMTLYVALYFYIAQTNYWAQYCLPKESEFDGTNDFHLQTKRVVDLSNSDFITVANWLNSCDYSLLEKISLSHLMVETKDTWRKYVRSSADVFVATSQT
jgi:hypothetical protein